MATQKSDIPESAKIRLAMKKDIEGYDAAIQQLENTVAELNEAVTNTVAEAVEQLSKI